MPVISTFFGMTIRMYYDDHSPPHFHASYQGYEAMIEIESGEILAGQLPRNAARLLRAWSQSRRDLLLSNWHNGQRLEPMEHIPGADADENR